MIPRGIARKTLDGKALKELAIEHQLFPDAVLYLGQGQNDAQQDKGHGGGFTELTVATEGIIDQDAGRVRCVPGRQLAHDKDVVERFEGADGRNDRQKEGRR